MGDKGKGKDGGKTKKTTTRQAADRSMHGDVEHLLNQPDRD